MGSRIGNGSAKPGFDPFRRLPIVVFGLLRGGTPEDVAERLVRELELLVPGATVELEPAAPNAIRAGILEALRPGAASSHAGRTQPLERFVLEGGRSHSTSVSLALVAHGVDLGDLHARRAGSTPFPDEQLEALVSVAEIASLALYHSHMRAELGTLAWTDELTGLPNRRRLLAETERCLSTQEPLSVVFLDFDGLKSVNDDLGHGVGDDLVRAVGRKLGELAHDGELAGRLAGDELVLLCPGLGADEVSARARELEARLAVVDVPAEVLARYGGTSAGTATAVPGDDVDALLARAGARMRVRKAERGAR